MSKRQSTAPSSERRGLYLAAPPRGKSSAVASIYWASGSFSALGMGPTLFLRSPMFGLTGLSDRRLTLLSCALTRFNISKGRLAKNKQKKETPATSQAFHLQGREAKWESRWPPNGRLSTWLVCEALCDITKSTFCNCYCKPSSKGLIPFQPPSLTGWNTVFLTAHKENRFYCSCLNDSDFSKDFFLLLFSELSFLPHTTHLSAAHPAVRFEAWGTFEHSDGSVTMETLWRKPWM